MINRLVIGFDADDKDTLVALSQARQLVAKCCYVTHHVPSGQWCVEYWTGAVFKLLLNNIDGLEAASDLADQMNRLGELGRAVPMTLWDVVKPE